MYASDFASCFQSLSHYFVLYLSSKGTKVICVMNDFKIEHSTESHPCMGSSTILFTDLLAN